MPDIKKPVTVIEKPDPHLNHFKFFQYQLSQDGETWSKWKPVPVLRKHEPNDANYGGRGKGPTATWVRYRMFIQGVWEISPRMTGEKGAW